ncbi:MAG: PcfJ domain-containing protein [Bacteroidales bacterium]|nr:PcfJ domain-containing protein [Bacteroidales bacterium]
MKPKNEFERRIERLSKTLAPIGDKHFEQAKDKCFDHEAWRSSKTKPCYCTFCGHEFDTPSTDTHTVCPECGHVLSVKITRKKRMKDTKMFAIMTTCKEFQVIRYVEIKKEIHLNWFPENRVFYGFAEVCRYWIDAQGNQKWQARCLGNVFWQAYWRYDTPITLKERGHDFYCQGVYAPQHIIPELKRNGYRFDIHDEAPATLFSSLLKIQEYETLWKAGYHKFLVHTRDINQVKQNWESLKVCIRHGYIPEETDIWYDMMNNLRELGRDTHNPHYVCPTDLKAAHDETLRKVNILRKRRADEARRRELRKDAVEFSKKKPFFGICFGNKKFKVTVLSSLQEYEDEGKAMHHCVFTNRYYAEEDTLCLSAKDLDGKRLATVELSLKNFKVLQCRAACNKVPPLRKEIVKLVESHASDFRKAKKLQTA